MLNRTLRERLLVRPEGRVSTAPPSAATMAAKARTLAPTVYCPSTNVERCLRESQHGRDA
jgi:hypothetical protein